MTTAAPLVIAEAGVNHNGDLGRAREMVAAAAAGIGAALATANVDDFPMVDIDVQHWPAGA